MSINLTFNNLTAANAAKLLAQCSKFDEADSVATVTASTPTITPAVPVTSVAHTIEAPTAEVTDDSPEWPQKNATGVLVDKSGVPFDDRIHGRGKTCLSKSGKWKYKRNIEADLIATVETELRALMLAPAPVAVAVAEVGNVHEAAIVPPVAVVAPVAPVEALAPIAAASMTFPDLIVALSKLYAVGTMNKETADSYATTVGVQSIDLMAARPDLIPQLWENIEKAVNAAAVV